MKAELIRDRWRQLLDVLQLAVFFVQAIEHRVQQIMCILLETGDTANMLFSKRFKSSAFINTCLPSPLTRFSSESLLHYSQQKYSRKVRKDSVDRRDELAWHVWWTFPLCRETQCAQCVIECLEEAKGTVEK